MLQGSTLQGGTLQGVVLQRVVLQGGTWMRRFPMVSLQCTCQGAA